MLNVGDLVFCVDRGRAYDPTYHVLFLITEGPFAITHNKVYVGIKSMESGHFRWCNTRDLAVFSKSPSQEDEGVL